MLRGERAEHVDELGCGHTPRHIADALMSIQRRKILRGMTYECDFRVVAQIVWE